MKLSELIRKTKLENIVKERFLKHIFYEFSHNVFTDDGFGMILENRGKIYESKGIFNGIDDIVAHIREHFRLLAHDVKPNETQILEKTFNKLDNFFIENLECKIVYTNTPDINYGSNGTFQSNYNIIKNNNTPKLEYGLLNITIISDTQYFANELESMISHELIHGYEIYNREVKGAFPFGEALYNYGYGLNLEWNDKKVNVLIYMLRQIKYYLVKAEQNAYFAQIRQQLIQHIKEVESSEDAYNVLRNKTEFKQFINVANYINTLYGIKNENLQKLLIDEWNQISNKKFQTFRQLRRILKNTYLRQFKIFETKISKMCEDVFKHYGNIRTVNIIRHNND